MMCMIHIFMLLLLWSTNAKIRNIISLHDVEKIVYGFVTSKLDYCNALLSACSSRFTNKLKFVWSFMIRHACFEQMVQDICWCLE